MPQTVFILGAGASHEAGLPTGSKLTETIAQLCDIRIKQFKDLESGDRLILEALIHHAHRTDVNPYLHAARRIRDGMPLAASIDNFIDAHRADDHVKLVGKLAIVRAILDAERHSGLYRDLTSPHLPLSMDRVGPTWFKWFWRLLCEDCTAETLFERCRSVSFVAFNYDRCIEQFLLFAARAYYAMSDADAAKAVSGISIFHPYGSIASLPWQENLGATDYGAEEIGAARLLELAGRIKTFTETTGAGEELAALREAVNAADRLVFLGFAFHRQNMRLLWPNSVSGAAGADRKVFGTAKGFSESDRNLITADIRTLSGVRGPTELRDITCTELFHEYSRSLSLL
jgi:hypothetical protein